jgi:hypothetical protein
VVRFADETDMAAVSLNPASLDERHPRYDEAVRASTAEQSHTG